MASLRAAGGVLWLVASLAALPSYAADVRPYVGLHTAFSSGKLNYSENGDTFTLGGKNLNWTGGGFGGVRWQFDRDVAIAAELDFTAGSVQVAQAASNASNVRAEVKLKNIWTASLVPDVSIADRWRLFGRIGGGRASGRGDANFGSGSVSAEESYTVLKLGLGVSHAVTDSLFVRGEFFYITSQKKDGITPIVTGLQLGLGYSF